MEIILIFSTIPHRVKTVVILCLIIIQLRNIFLNSEEYLNIFPLKKESRNYIRKNKLNDFYKNENKNNYNVNYINNLEKLNNCCIYENKINFFNNNNYNDIRLTKNYFLGNNLDFLFK